MSAPLVVARVPFLPVHTATRLFDAASPCDELRALLREEPSILPAIYVSSPSLHDALVQWLEDDAAPMNSAALRAMIYIIRMSARCTPYGLFAGIGEVTVGEEATLHLGDAWRTLTRPDMGVALDVANAVSKGPKGSSVRYIANQSVIERADRIHTINLHLTNQTVKDGETLSEQRTASMRHTAAVREVRALSHEPIERGALATQLAQRLGETEENCTLFVERMIEAGILISEFDLAPLGNPQRRLASRLLKIDGETGEAFTALLDRTAALDMTSVGGRSVDEYRTLGEAFVELAEAKSATSLHIDLVATFEGTLPARVLDEVRRAAILMERAAKPAEMKTYRERFSERYEGFDRMVPLLELVDADFGLGVPGAVSLVSDIDPKIDRKVRRIAFEAEHAHRTDVELSDEELDLLFPKLTDRDRGGHDFAFNVLAESLDALQNGDFYVAVYPMAPRATQTMGRFSLALGGDFTERMQSCARAGNDRDELTAELVFPAFGRMYNVATRSSTADAELHIGVGESQECATVIVPNDLWVGLEDGRFFLWSQSLQRRIRVVESHVFATTSIATNVCRFLAQLSSQDRLQLGGFRWGGASSFRALPRVTHGRLILAPRVWTFDAEELGKTVESVAARIAVWLEFWGLPQYVFLRERDHLLMLDLRSPLSAALLHDQAAEGGAIELTEMLAQPSQLWIEGSRGKYLAEFIAAFPAEAPTAPSGQVPIAPVIVSDRQRFGPGSMWTYAKFYVDRHATDSFISTDLAQLVAQLQDCEIDRWFFLRYADPATHVRLRVRSRSNAEAVRQAIAGVAETWLASRRIERYAFDTYDPEYERYGGVAELDSVEAFWTEDSAGCVGLLKTLGHSDDDRVAGAAALFDEFIQGAPGADAVAIDILGRGKRLSLGTEDRKALKSIQSERKSRPSNLAAALQTADIERRFASILHLHCNRLGVAGEGERRVGSLVRSAALSRRSRSMA